MRARTLLKASFSAALATLVLTTTGCSSIKTKSEAFREDLCSPKDNANDPLVSSIAPADGRRTGGTLVTITGKGFEPGVAVMLGKARCVGVSLVDKNTLTCRTGKHPSGKVDVLVANTNRSCGLLTSGYTYAPAVIIKPTVSLISTGNTVSFQAARGVLPYRFDIVSGPGSIDSESGLFTAGTEAGTTIVKVTDSAGTSDDALITINAALAISAPRHIMAKGTYTFAASGGVPPYTFSLVSGEGNVDSSGKFSAPGETGTDVVAVDDSNGNHSEVAIDVQPDFEIVPNVRTIMVTNRLSFKGGLAPATFSILAGLGSIDPNSGEFVAPEIPGKTVLRLQDAAGNISDTEVTTEPALVLYPVAKTIMVSDQLSFIGTGGVPPYKYTLTGPGTLDGKQVYTAPDLPGTATVKLEDSLGNSVTAEITITVEGIQLSRMATGHSHRCLVVDGAVKCWGRNNRSQLGSKTARPQETLPVDVEGLSSGVLGIAAGLNHTCVLMAGGSVKCWGDNTYGQLGNGTTESSLTPVKVTGLSAGVQSITAGAYHTCAVADGTLLCWGDNRRGQLGNGTTIQSPIPVQVKWLTQGVEGVAAGTFHTCGLVQGGVRCWGYNFSGQLGDGTVADRLTPVPVRGLDTGVRMIRLGDFHSCAVTDEDLKCWGYNGSGQLGRSPGRNGLIPRKVELAQLPTALALGSYHTCALLPDKTVQCWGYNHEGQVRPGANVKVLTPETVPFAQGADYIAAAANHSCAILDKKIRCWGFNGVTRFSDDPIELR